MVRTLLTNQYKTSPEGKLRNRKVKMRGMNIIILC
jgi:hypothetical protein